MKNWKVLALAGLAALILASSVFAKVSAPLARILTPPTNSTIKVIDETTLTGTPTPLASAAVILKDSRYSTSPPIVSRTNRVGEARFNLRTIEYDCTLVKRGYKTKSMPEAFMKRTEDLTFNTSMRPLRPFPSGEMIYLKIFVIRGLTSGPPASGILVEVRPEGLTAPEISDYGVQGVTGSDGRVRLRVPATAERRYLVAVDERSGKYKIKDISIYKIWPDGNVTIPGVAASDIPQPLWIGLP